MAENLTRSITSHIEHTKSERRKNRLNAYELGTELLFKTKKDLDELKKTIGADDVRYQSVADLLSTEILQCGIDYFKAMKDNSDFSEASSLEILNSAKELSSDPQIQKRIEDNIKGIGDWVSNQSLRDSQNNIYDFNKILLKTAFSFMTCDGHIAPNEVALIRKMAEEDKAFGDIDIDTELDFLIEVINTMGMGFLKDYFKVLKNAQLKQEQELKLIEMAIKTLYADGRVDYNEVKFFRIFRSLLSVTDKQIFDLNPNLSDQFLESDIFSHEYLGQLFDDYFEKVDIPTFEKLSEQKRTDYVDPEKYKQ
ncbi:MAG: TerB family tellurite resistance protein [Reichenbachiella sp.]|uniref:TerB family tellurite resistance protein n=1 Tax=Reichenbachiella sp. TaxID=2184521 RepID=UPI00329A078D